MKLIRTTDGYVVANYIQAVVVEEKRYINADTEYFVKTLLRDGHNFMTENFKTKEAAMKVVEEIAQQLRAEDSNENN